MNKKDEKFVYFDSEEKEHSIIITDGDFKQVNADKKIHDVKFETKPTTFMVTLSRCSKGWDAKDYWSSYQKCFRSRKITTCGIK